MQSLVVRPSLNNLAHRLLYAGRMQCNLPLSICSLNPFRTPVPFWGQITWNYSGLSPNRDWGAKGVNMVSTVLHCRRWYLVLAILGLYNTPMYFVPETGERP